MLGHLAACIWIYMGLLDRDLPPEEQTSWVYVNDLYGADTDPITQESVGRSKSNTALYAFALYWVFTTLTTVGYGDYAGGNTKEYLVTLGFEFLGFCYNAVLISVMSSFFASDANFDDLLDSRLAEMDLWMKRIERSYKPYYMPPLLGQNIITTVTEAFHFDYNLIVEEYTLY